MCVHTYIPYAPISKGAQIQGARYPRQLNFDKTYFIQYTNKSTSASDTQITYEDKQISIVNETNFLSYLLTIISPGKHTLNALSLN
jgi:predicted GH43/DUF377 family glycosyl hydrolase